MRGRVLAMGLLLAAGTAMGQAADDPVRRDVVRFAPGAVRTVIEDTLTGRESVLYTLGAEAGQRLTVSVTASNAGTGFNLYGPGSGPGDAAMAVAEASAPDAAEVMRIAADLKVSGVYTISVYLVRAAARRDERSDFTLTVGLEGGDLDAPLRGDFADGLQGGPDFWAVATASGQGRLNIRAAPSAGAAIVTVAPHGAALRNLGCRMNEGRRWCRVETTPDAQTGWAAGDFLVEGAAPAGWRPAPGPGSESAPETDPAPAAEPETGTDRVIVDPATGEAVVSRELAGGDAVNVVVAATAGQRLDVRLTETAPGIRFNVFGPLGDLLHQSGPGAARFGAPVPSSGDYIVTVFNAGAAAGRVEMVLGLR